MIYTIHLSSLEHSKFKAYHLMKFFELAVYSYTTACTGLLHSVYEKVIKFRVLLRAQ